MRRRSSRSRPGPASPTCRSLQKMLWAAKRPVVILGGSRWSEKAWRRDAAFRRALRAAGRHDVPPRPSVRSDASAITPAISASVPIRNCWRASRRPIWCCWSAGGWAKCRRRATRCSTFRSRSRRFVHVHPGAEELGRVYRPHLGDQRLADRVRRGARRLAAAERRFRGADETETAHADYLAWTEKATTCRARSISARSWCGCASSLPPDDIICQRRRQFLRLDASLLSLPQLRHACRPDLRLDGLRRAGGGRR